MHGNWGGGISIIAPLKVIDNPPPPPPRSNDSYDDWQTHRHGTRSHRSTRHSFLKVITNIFAKPALIPHIQYSGDSSISIFIHNGAGVSMGENAVWVNISRLRYHIFLRPWCECILLMYLTAEFGACDHHQLHMAVLSIIVSGRNAALRW